ncbi:MAG: amidohydrolase [Bacteroides sp.]|nr:amidohydrolase [Bacteroides sp.]
MESLRVAIVQTDIVWENKQENLLRLHEKLKVLRGATEIVVLPETTTTGFSMNTHLLAEPVTGDTIRTLQQWATEYNIAIIGSYIACDEQEQPNHCYNRAFFLTPEGEQHFYDKHHLFRMGGEAEAFTPGNRCTIINYQGWNIMLQICYDLRFPVWSRNMGNKYDLLIYIANWPASRRKVWDTLLQARALENQSYVCGVNRIGKDGNGLSHNGGSVILSPKGESLIILPDNIEATSIATLSHTSLNSFREKFPVWKDADTFSI